MERDARAKQQTDKTNYSRFITPGTKKTTNTIIMLRAQRIVSSMRSASALLQPSAQQKAAAASSPSTFSVRIGGGTTCRYMSEGGDRLHSTDIAFKPAESGWGGGSSKYSNNFDKIFGGGGKKTDEKKDDALAKRVRSHVEAAFHIEEMSTKSKG